MEGGVRAVIYCRVSTSSETQMESLEKQVEEAERSVKQLGYELVDRFVDEGKTGTTRSTRKEYLRMISLIEQNRFDVIVTKSLDRMNRNILDFYLFLDLIIKNQIRLYFYLDRSFYRADDKIIIGIKAILAEEYSRELSKKLCSAHEKRQERGQVVMLGSMTYGYRKVMQKDGKRKVVVEEAEADMIRLIFDYCKEGYGARAISSVLFERGYRNRNGNRISENTIRRIIRNPLVTGTAVMNRVRFDFNTKTTVHTDPAQWVSAEGAVPAIISREDWERANAQMDMRVQGRGNQKGVQKRGLNGGPYDFSGKLCCGLCGRPYYRAQRVSGDKKAVQWRCSTYMQSGRKKENGGCAGVSLDETILTRVLAEAADTYFSPDMDGGKEVEELLGLLEKILHTGGGNTDGQTVQARRDVLHRRQEVLLEKYLDGKISDADYALMDQKINVELLSMREDNGADRDVNARLKEIASFLEREGEKRSAVTVLLDYVREVVIYPDCVKLTADKTVKISLAPYCTKQTRCAMEQSKNRICELMKENPKITVAQIAKDLNMGSRTVSNRIRELKGEGRIGVSGHGIQTKWMVLRSC